VQIYLRKKKLSDGRESLYLDINSDGIRKYEFLKLYIKRGNSENKEILMLAEKIKSQRLIDLSNKEHNQVSTQKKNTSFLKYFENYVNTKKKWSNYFGALKHFKLFLNGKDITFKHIDKAFLENFADYLSKEANLKQSTAFLYLRKIKEVLYKASNENFIMVETVRRAKSLPKGKTERGYLELFEIEKLVSVDYKNSEIKRAFLFSCFTGLRQSDVRNLKWSDIKNNTIRIKMQKVSKPIEIPLSKTALELIKTNNIHHLPDVRVFDLPTDRTTINRHLTRWFKLACVDKKAFYHLSRHTFATLNITSGNDLYTVSKLLGHSNIKTTEIYSKVIDEKKKQAIDNLPAISL